MARDDSLKIIELFKVFDVLIVVFDVLLMMSETLSDIITSSSPEDDADGDEADRDN